MDAVSNNSSTSSGSRGTLTRIILFAMIPTTVLLAVALTVTVRLKDREETRLEAERDAAIVAQQIESNRLLVMEYLLSGDTRDLDRLDAGEQKLERSFEQAMKTADSEKRRASLQRALNLEHRWREEFVKPVIEERKRVDAGSSTIALMQIHYLELDPGAWSRKFSIARDDVQGKLLSANY